MYALFPWLVGAFGIVPQSDYHHRQYEGTLSRLQVKYSLMRTQEQEQQKHI